MEGSSRIRGLLLVALMIQVAVIAWAVFNPSSATADDSILHVSRWLEDLGISDRLSDFEVVQVALNVLMFVPVGWTFRLLLTRVPWWAWLVVGASTSGAVELGQLIFLSERYASWGDVTANTAGFVIGALLGCATGLVWRARRARRSSAWTVL